MRTLRLVVAAGVAGTLLGCGQKGPLLLPEAQHPHKKIGVPRPSSSSEPQTPLTPAPTTAPGNTAPAAPAPSAASPGDAAPSPAASGDPVHTAPAPRP